MTGSEILMSGDGRQQREGGGGGVRQTAGDITKTRRVQQGG